MEHTQLQLTLPVAALQRDVQRAIDLVGFGLQAATNSAPADLSIPEVFGEVVAAKDRALSVEQARNEFRVWLIANGLRDCVEAIGPALEWARRFCFIWTRSGTAQPLEDGRFQLRAELSGEEWNTEFVRGAKRFDRLPLPDKLEHLAGTYPWSAPELSPHILSLNALRNCLAHRDGVVGPPDLKDPSDSGLLARWRRLVISASNEQSDRVLTAGSRVEAGESVRISFVDAERLFGIGERVTLSAQDFVEMALTFVLFAMQLQSTVDAVQNLRRPTPDSSIPSQPGPHSPDAI